MARKTSRSGLGNLWYSRLDVAGLQLSSASASMASIVSNDGSCNPATSKRPQVSISHSANHGFVTYMQYDIAVWVENLGNISFCGPKFKAVQIIMKLTLFQRTHNCMSLDYLVFVADSQRHAHKFDFPVLDNSQLNVYALSVVFNL